MASKYAFSKTLKELRFLLCQTSEASSPLRSFIVNSYPAMKKQNPNIPILIREASGVEPRMIARFEFGRESQLQLQGLSEKEIETKVSDAVKGQ